MLFGITSAKQCDYLHLHVREITMKGGLSSKATCHFQKKKIIEQVFKAERVGLKQTFGQSFK